MKNTANPYPTPGQKLEDHPISQIFPMMDPDDYEALKGSLMDGYKGEPIVTLEGKILDGRNRQKACVELGIIPQYRPYDFTKDGTSPTAFVMRRNLARRQLTPSQKAAVAHESLPFFQDEAKARQSIAASGPRKRNAATGEGTVDTSESQEQPEIPPAPQPRKPRKAAAEAAAAVGATTRSVERASRIAKKDPAALADVKAGKTTLAAAEKKLTASEKADLLRKEGVTRIRKVCGKTLAQAVEDLTRLKTKQELEAFVALDDSRMKEIAGLIEVGWKVKDALAYKAKTPTRNHKIIDLLDRAAAAGGDFTVEIDWATITVRRKN